MKYVTIFADASWCSRTKAGGFGCWIKGDGEAITRGGPLKASRSSDVAECQALANALAVAHQRGVLSWGDTVVLQSDCTSALSAILHVVPGAVDMPAKGGLDVPPRRPGSVVSPEVQEVMEFIAWIVTLSGVKLWTRHVKGHSGLGTGRHYVNDLCDRLARKGMEEVRKRERQEAQKRDRRKDARRRKRQRREPVRCVEGPLQVVPLP